MSDPIISRSQARRILEQTEAPAIADLTAQVAALTSKNRNLAHGLEMLIDSVNGMDLRDTIPNSTEMAEAVLRCNREPHPPAGEGK